MYQRLLLSTLEKLQHLVVVFYCFNVFGEDAALAKIVLGAVFVVLNFDVSDYQICEKNEVAAC